VSLLLPEHWEEGSETARRLLHQPSQSLRPPLALPSRSEGEPLPVIIPARNASSTLSSTDFWAEAAACMQLAAAERVSSQKQRIEGGRAGGTEGAEVVEGGEALLEEVG
jgi:hypothetical protein